MKVTYFRRYTDQIGATRETTRERLFAWLGQSVEAEDKYSVPCWSPATFRDGRRLASHVEAVSLLVFDVDCALEHQIQGIQAYLGWSGFAHTTHGGSLARTRWRIVVDVDRPMSAAEHAQQWAFAADGFACIGIQVDRACSDPSRLYFGPSHPAAAFCSAGPVSHVLEGEPVSVIDRAPVIRNAPRWTYEGSVNAPPTLYERARRYVMAIPGAVSGQGGHARTFGVAQALVRGFELSEEDAYSIISDWNAACLPPWKQHELRHKLHSAAERGTMVMGSLRTAPRTR